MTKAKKQNTKTNKSTSTRDLRLEALESRQLLSVSPANVSTDDLIPAYTAPAEIDAEPQVTLFTENTGGGAKCGNCTTGSSC